MAQFNGRLRNLPEHIPLGNTTNRGRCEYTISFCGDLMLLFIEYKKCLEGSNEHLSNIVAQVIAEIDTADAWNSTMGRDGVTIRAILTDGKDFMFFKVDFRTYVIQRGIPTDQAGIRSFDHTRITIPHDEEDPAFLLKLKVLCEVVSDTFIGAYLSAVNAKQLRSHRHAGTQATDFGVRYLGCNLTNFWDTAYAKGQSALKLLREATTARTLSTWEAEILADTGISLLPEVKASFSSLTSMMSGA